MPREHRRNSPPGRIALQKRLGQHLLTDPYFLESIVKAASLGSDDSILEIGPGPGNLTKHLLGAAARVAAVELDRRFEPELRRLEQGARGRLALFFTDILAFDFSALPALCRGPWKVLANIPYYISTPLIEKLLEHQGLFSHIYLTIQRELAERICAPGGSRDRGSFTFFVEYHAVPSLLIHIPAAAFTPPPEVDSSLIGLTIRETPPADSSPRLLFSIIRRAFAQRRKGIKNSLKGIQPVPGDRILSEVLRSCGIDPMARPETLALADFDRLACLLERGGKTHE
ncbi:MAG: 16S rRNA (adenine(1518)-N(6)/adenine(1519)-N(6))-dimethyltransferase RsmA [Candidatus Eremiobacteraeota bacterium]|nr:16S rRNA (adenine(1518)-N(6)/adenine(1519)-N(6))-dimethyltransferase RsmA [Candidatus Eremiobacteraeota bacterium]